MRKRVFMAVLPLAAALFIPFTGTATAAPKVPKACEVPPEAGINLADYNLVIGTNRSETLKGTSKADFICGRLGNDKIYGYGGDDIILGDTTTFFGDVEAPGGDDWVDAGSGMDAVLTGPGDDVAYGGSGDDFIALAVGSDVGYGGSGNDVIIGGFGEDRIYGGLGNDQLAGGFNDDVISGGSGDDSLYGELPPPEPGQPAPPPRGPQGHDVCRGGAGTDTAADCDVTVGIP